MDIKTPEQIADERFAANYQPPAGQTMSEVVDYLAASGDLGYDGIRAMIIAAVEADRAQRQPELYIVQNDVGDVVDVFRDPDKATEAYQGETYSVIEETVWEPGEW